MMKQRLTSMTVEALLIMREEIGAILTRKAGALRKQLAAIGGVPREATLLPDRRTKGQGRKVRAKYRDPKTGESWSGRGAPARWIAAYEKSGRKREDFLIARPEGAVSKKSKSKRRAKTSRRKKRAKAN
jgi:DNA-binding protein H-NS